MNNISWNFIGYALSGIRFNPDSIEIGGIREQVTPTNIEDTRWDTDIGNINISIQKGVKMKKLMFGIGSSLTIIACSIACTWWVQGMDFSPMSWDASSRGLWLFFTLDAAIPVGIVFYMSTDMDKK